MNNRLGSAIDIPAFSDTKKKNVSNTLHIFPKPSPKVRYVLEGGVIKVLKTNENGVERCVQIIALRAASIEILNRVECTNLTDSMLLEEVKDEKMGKTDNCGNYNKNGLTAKDDSPIE